MSSTPLCAQSTVTIYENDSVGNRTVATNLIRFSDAQVFAFQPQVALHSDVVNIFGRNLPVEDPSILAATIGGTPVPMISVAPNVATFEVPPGVMTGALVVTLPGGPPVDLGTLYIEGIVLLPKLAIIPYSQTVCFSVTVIGPTDPAVVWTVESLSGAPETEDTGFVDVDNCYVPPDPLIIDAAGQVRVTAISVELPHIQAQAVVMLVGSASAASSAAPLVVVPAVGLPGEMAATPTLASPPALVVRPGVASPGELPPNRTKGKPPVQVLRPGAAEADQLQPNPTVAKPPASVEIEERP